MKNLFDYHSIREYLRDIYICKKKRRPSFSHRVLAMRVGFSNGYFSRILSGEKKLSTGLVEKFITYLQLDGNEALYFRALVNHSQSENEEEKEKAFKKMIAAKKSSAAQLEKDQLELFHSWYHGTLFSLCHMGEITGTTDFTEIGAKLYPPVSEVELKASLKLLLRLDLICENNGTYEVKVQFLTSGQKHKNYHIQSYLLNSILQAKNALLSTPQSERDITTMTISVSQKGYVEIQNLVSEFKKQVNDVIATDSDLDRVCQLNIQQFPLYKKGGKDA